MPPTNDSNLNSWRNISGLGHGSSWGSQGFNYDNNSEYPPGFSNPSNHHKSGSQADQRHVDVQRAMANTGSSSYSGSRRSSVSTAYGTEMEHDPRVQQQGGGSGICSALRGDVKEFDPYASRGYGYSSRASAGLRGDAAAFHPGMGKEGHYMRDSRGEWESDDF